VKTKPNVLVLFTDDQRFDTIAALGNEAISTPNIDRLVSRGTACTHAHIPGGTSPAVCMPSRAMLHSGRSLFHIHQNGPSIPADHTTMGEAFGSAGYRTFGTGKWHNGRESFNRSFAEGDEIFFGGMADHWNVPAYRYDATGRYDSTLPMCPEPGRSNDVVLRNCDHIASGTHSSELISAAANRFLESVPPDAAEPFFAYVSFLAPHDPRTMPESFRRMYDAETVELPPNFAAGHAFDNGELHIRDELLAGFPRTHAETKRHIAEYYAMISHLDHQIGMLLDTLERRGLRENTIVVLAGDNGLALGQHGLFGKQSCYEHSIRVPLIVAGPDIASGIRRTEPVYLFDIFSTLCDLTDVSKPESVEGRSFAPLLMGNGGAGAYEERDTLYFAYTDKHRAVKSNGHKLIEYAVSGTHSMTQLFDLESDPWERHNLAFDSAHTDTVASMRAQLKSLRDEWDDLDSSWGTTFWQAVDI